MQCSCLFLAALWPPDGRELASLLFCVWCFLVVLCVVSRVRCGDCIDSLFLPSSFLLKIVLKMSDVFCETYDTQTSYPAGTHRDSTLIQR